MDNPIIIDSCNALEGVELADEVLSDRLPRKHSNRGALNAPRE